MNLSEKWEFEYVKVSVSQFTYECVNLNMSDSNLQCVCERGIKKVCVCVCVYACMRACVHAGEGK